jgi:ethanolamine ammonia-lyase large subunit
LYVRKVLGLKPAPEFEQWLLRQNIISEDGRLLPVQEHKLLQLINT